MTNESLAADEPLSLPHFDDEATLLSARPVVPLHDVKAQSHSKRNLAAAFSIIGALILGAVGASVIYKQREPQQNFVEDTAKVPDRSEHAGLNVLAGASGEATGAAINSEQPSAAGSPSTPETARAETRNVQTSAVAAKQSPRASRNGVKPDSDENLAQYRDDESGNEEMELRREERREERRLRRERRNRVERSSDELLRIREIFEGRPRP